MTNSGINSMHSNFGFYCPEWRYLIIIDFDPYTGVATKNAFSSFHEILHNEFNGRERGNKRAIKKRVLERLQEWKNYHNTTSGTCPRLYDLVIGDEAGSTRAAYIPQIRAYVIYKEYATRDLGEYTGGDFDAMLYCPFCGAKLPERLDDKLTEILQGEYGLSSWKDYKKAPKEFHTDEWWKKRGL